MQSYDGQEVLSELLSLKPKKGTGGHEEAFLGMIMSEFKIVWLVAESREERLLTARILNAVERIPVGGIRPNELDAIVDALRILAHNNVTEEDLYLTEKLLYKVGRSPWENWISSFVKPSGPYLFKTRGWCYIEPTET